MLSSKRALQIAVAVAGIVPVSAGLSGILIGPSMVPGNEFVTLPLDSHFRYLSGLLLGIGLAAWTMIPNIEKNGKALRLITAIVFIGGLGRLWSLLVMGVPDIPMLLALGMEVIVTPLLALWQWKIAKDSKN